MFTSLWSRAVTGKRPAARNRAPRERLRLYLEPLEDRCLLSLTSGPLVLLSDPDPLADCPPAFFGPDVAGEPYVVVNPGNPKHIVAAWIGHGNAGIVDGASFDGGKTWQNVAIPGLTQCTGGTQARVWNPWLSFAPNGDLYSICGAYPDGLMLVNKSTNGGLTWSGPIQLNTIHNQAQFDDKPSITADPNTPNNVYATWVRFNQSFGSAKQMETMFARSTDGGNTWQPEQSIHSAPNSDFNWGNQIVVLPDGTLINAFTEGQYKNHHHGVITLLRSTDRGQTWSDPIAALVQEPLADPNINPPNGIVTDPDTGQAVEAHPMFFSIALDRNSGNLYAAWLDARFSNFQYNSIAFSMSSDGGFTWSTPIQANQTPNTVPPLDRQAWNPTVAVAADGTVAVSYYDFRNNTSTDTGALTDYWLAYSPAPATNPGTWSEVRLTDTSFNLEQAPTRFSWGYWLADYEGLVAVGKDFVAVWGMPDGTATAQESVYLRRLLAGSHRSADAAPRNSVMDSTLLHQEQLQRLPSEAIALWQAVGVDVSALQHIDVRIANLGGTTLGLAFGHTMTLGANAAGWGWFVDQTPGKDSKVNTPVNQVEQNRLDSLNVVDRALGHLFGKDHSEEG